MKQSIGPLVECRGASNLKGNLLKDIYNLYSFGEGLIHCLPRNMIKCDSKYVDQCIQTDSCLSSIIFASKLYLDTLKSELMHKIPDLRHEMLNTNLSRSPMPNTLLSSHSQPTIFDALPSLHSQSVSQVEDSQFLLLSSEPDPQSVAPKIINENSYQCNEIEHSNHNNYQSKSNCKIVIAGNSLLHCFKLQKDEGEQYSINQTHKKRGIIFLGLFLVCQLISASIIISNWILFSWLLRMTFQSMTSLLKI